MFGGRKQRFEAQLDAELRDHLDRQIADYVTSGMSPEKARRQARLDFGGTGQVKEECREVQYWQGFALFMQDLKYTLRSLRKSPCFSTVGVLVLAFGIGSNLAVFSLIETLFLRPLPVERPAGLVEISSIDKDGRRGAILSKVLDPLRGETIFRGVCGVANPLLPTEVNGSVHGSSVLTMSGDCFTTLGLHPQIGRTFTLSDEAPGSERVALLTDSLWRSAFAGSNSVLGQRIQVGGAIFNIIGVTGRQFTGFRLGFPPEVIIPLAQRPSDLMPAGTFPIYYWVDIFARRSEGVSQQKVQARMSVVEKQLLEQSLLRRFDPAQKRDYLARRISVSPAESGAESFLKRRFGQPLYCILGICASVLLIACVNLTSLLLARGLRRHREIAVRLALGANRTSIVRMLALESSVLVLAGALAGVLIADWARDMVAVHAGALLSINPGPALDSRTAIFFAGMVALVAFVLAVAPGWQASRTHRGISRNGGRGVIGSKTRTQKILLALQIAVTLALVSGSGLFTSSMKHLNELNLGVRTEGTSEAQLAPLPAGYSGLTPGPYYRDLLRQVEAIPEVSSASLADFAPYYSGTNLEPVGVVENSQSRSDLRAKAIAVSDRFFETLGIPVVAGESFRAVEGEPGEPSAVVSQSLASLLGGDRLIGQHIRIGEAGPYQRLKVAGIVANAKLSLEDPSDTRPLAVYTNLWQHPEKLRFPVLLVKTTGRFAVSPPVLRRVVQSRGREYVEHFSTLENQKDEALIENRWLAYLSAAFGVLALALAATGLFGLLSYHVASRTSEIGIRMALGAVRLEIHWLVLRQLLPVMVSGMLAGLGLALVIGKVVAGLVFGVGIHDPRLLGASVGLLSVTAILAAWIPARRAASVDPLVALRHESSP